MRLFRSGLRKLRRRPATWVTFGLLAGLLVLIFLAVGASARQAPTGQAQLAARLFVTFPEAYRLVLAMVLGLGGLLAVTYGAAVAGAEWTWGTLKSAVARGESRTWYTLTGYAAVAVMAVLGILAAFMVGLIAAILGALAAGVSLDGLGDTAVLAELPELFLRGALAISMQVAMGFAIATIARSQLAGIGVGIGLFFGEQFAGIFVPEIVQWLPFDAAGAVTATTGAGGGMGGGLGTSLDPGTALVVVVAWLVAALVASSLWTERAEISG
jgi:ABC-2 type transport system permease protein